MFHSRGREQRQLAMLFPSRYFKEMAKKPGGTTGLDGAERALPFCPAGLQYWHTLPVPGQQPCARGRLPAPRRDQATKRQGTRKGAALGSDPRGRRPHPARPALRLRLRLRGSQRGPLPQRHQEPEGWAGRGAAPGAAPGVGEGGGGIRAQVAALPALGPRQRRPRRAARGRLWAPRGAMRRARGGGLP